MKQQEPQILDELGRPVKRPQPLRRFIASKAGAVLAAAVSVLAVLAAVLANIEKITGFFETGRPRATPTDTQSAGQQAMPLTDGVSPFFALDSAARFEPYSRNQTSIVTAGVSLEVFVLDSRHTDLESKESPDEKYAFELRGDAWPVLLVAFQNGTAKPVLFKGVEVTHTHVDLIANLSGVTLEPFAAVSIHNGRGFQPFVPPLLLPSGEAGAIHLRLSEDPRIEDIPFGEYQLTFHIGNELIESPQFLWLPKRLCRPRRPSNQSLESTCSGAD